MVSLAFDGKQQVYTSLAFIIVNTTAVTLRLIAKRKTRKGIGADDVLMVAALLLQITWNALVISSLALIYSTKVMSADRVGLANLAGTWEPNTLKVAQLGILEKVGHHSHLTCHHLIASWSTFMR